MFTPVDQKIDFPALERDLLKEWYNKGIVDKYLRRNDKSTKRYSFLDGPITANNPMGVHHAWGRTYKDLWQKYWNMRGYKQRFQNGFDCQGLWVEVEVEKELGIRNKKDIENLIPGDKKASIAKFVQLCKDRVSKFSAIQTEQTKRLGNFMHWDNSYYTMSDENNYMIWHFLKTCFDRGWIYKGKDSVPWCPRCETAISQHEMLTEDYKELTHETVFVKLPITTEGWEDTYLLVWTTTPWTVPANVAVGINIKFTYKIWKNKETNEKIIFIDKDENGEVPHRTLKGKTLAIADYVFSGVEGEYIAEKNVSGKDLLGLTYEGPFDHLPRVQAAQEENPDTFHTVIDASEVVVATEGTGLLHTAPGAGKEDFDLGKKENLPVLSIIADDASYLEDMGDFSGKNAKKHPELIIDYLTKIYHGKHLLKSMNYTHRYPACWRCRSELVWKVAEEWYIAMDKKEDESGKTLREQMMDTAKMIEWHPDFGLDRELDWLTNMHDWLISKKNRYWGLALPIYECKKCNSFEVIGGKDALHKRAVSGWSEFEGKSPHKPYIDEVQIACGKCDEVLSRIDDVGNVWLDAGIVPFSTLIDPETKELSYITDKKYWSEWFPADFITESFPGQFKNWFYSLIAMSTVLEKKNPFKRVLGFASMLAEDGRAMHKSWGNAIEFNEGADKIGVDVMRWMFATHDPEQNLLFGYKKADETRRRFHLMLWNVYNFFITYANTDKWQPENDSKTRKESDNILDIWVLSRMHQTIKITTESLENYAIQKASLAIEDFVNDVSLWYVRRSRDRVGPTAEDTNDKLLCYQTLHEVLVNLTKLLAPFTPFLAEEMYKNLTGDESVHLADWPKNVEEYIKDDVMSQMLHTRKIVEAAHAKRKEVGIKVRQPLAKMIVNPSSEYPKLTSIFNQLLKDEINVKDIEFLSEKKDIIVSFDTHVSDELKAEGEARDIVRAIQEERKKLGTAINEQVDAALPSWPKDFEEYIKRNALIRTLTNEDEIKITKI